MVIQRIYNNNIVSSFDERNREILLMGKGIGWQVKPGQPVDKKKIEKIFRMDTPESMERLKQLFLEVDMEAIQISSQIVDSARTILKKKLNKNVYITLTDHISFAIERMKKGIVLKSALQWEIQKLYPAEFQIGKDALKLIYEKLQIELPLSEAGSIALHLVNAEYDCNMEYTQQMTEIIQNSLNIVRYTFNVHFNEESIDYQRFTTHLLYFAQRVLNGKTINSEPDEMYELMQLKYPKQMACARKIRDLVQKQYSFSLGEEELTFLTIHIVRVTTKFD